LNGKPTNNLAASGVLLRALDGDGVISTHGFLNGPPKLETPLDHQWTPNPNGEIGDRLSATLVNARHPDAFRFMNKPPSEWEFLPGLVLKPSEAIQRRISCIGWRDLWSINYNCYPKGKDGRGCLPGCPRRQEWCDVRGGIANQRQCQLFVNPLQMHECCVAWPLSSLEQMMQMQDTLMVPWGGCTSNCDDPDNGLAFMYNEIVFDKWDQPWEADLPQLIDAVYMLPRASETVRQFARAFHRALLQRVNLTADQLPLLLYNASNVPAPFSIASE